MRIVHTPLLAVERQSTRPRLQPPSAPNCRQQFPDLSEHSFFRVGRRAGYRSAHAAGRLVVGAETA
ncbi:MAG: hypothetical protein ACUVT2_12690, partial [Thiobacillaceae bacterium]